MAGVNRELADFLRRARASVDPLRAGLPSDVLAMNTLAGALPIGLDRLRRTERNYAR